MLGEVDQKTAWVPATRFIYSKGKWWRSVIQSYASLKQVLRGMQTEQNHLIHQAILRKGPPETRPLVRYAPSITLTMDEHRGAKYSYHKMPDGERVGRGAEAFFGCGMDAYLASRGIDVNASSFTREQVANALDASIGILGNDRPQARGRGVAAV